MRRILAASRYVIGFAAIGSFLSATFLLIFGVLSVFDIAYEYLLELDLSSHGIEELAVEFIKLIDIFLLGTVLYIVGLGLYELFVDPTLPLPKWLIINDLDHLKEKLVGVIIVLLGVNFLGAVVSWDGESDILQLGLAVALVVGALSFVLNSMHRGPHNQPPTAPPPSANDLD